MVPAVVVAADGTPTSEAGEAIISSDAGDLMMPTEPRAKVDPVGASVLAVVVAADGTPRSEAGKAIVSSDAGDLMCVCVCVSGLRFRSGVL